MTKRNKAKLEIPPKRSSGTSINQKFTLLWLAAIMIMSVLPYIPTIGGEFTLDDVYLIPNDLLSHSLAYAPLAFRTDFLRGTLGPDIPYYRPLITISYQVNYQLFGPNPTAFRVTNILISLAIAFLIFAFARRLTNDNVIAGVAGILFSVLPSHAESVAWISGRTDLLSCLFVMLSFLAFTLNYSKRPAFNWPLATLGSLAFMCGLLSKENALILPILIAGYIWIYGGGVKPRELLKWAAVILPPIIVFVILRRWIVGVSITTHPFFLLKERLLCVGIAYITYLRMMFIPDKAHVIYDAFPIAMKYPILGIAAWIVPIAMVAFSIWAKKREPLVAFASMWIFATVLPVTNILLTSGPLPAERFVYLGSIGSALLLGWLVRQMWNFKPKSIRLWPLITIAFVSWYSLYSAAQLALGCPLYTNNVRWARAVAATDCRFSMMHAAAGQWLSGAGLFEEGAKEYEKCLSIADGRFAHYTDYLSLARLKMQMEQTDEAIDILEQAAARYPRNPVVHYDLGLAYSHIKDWPNAAKAFERSVSIDPDSRIGKKAAAKLKSIKH